jgi:hypothetical protein
MTAADRDLGVPKVEVTMTRRDLHPAILDVFPVGIDSREMASKDLEDLVARAAAGPVSSPDFRITQHVDYFPLRQGLEPMLPMSCTVQWTGKGLAPPRLSVVESVEDRDLSTVILKRDLEVHWNRKGLSWERDGRLRSGSYVWRVAVHDDRGKILASTEEKVGVGFPQDPSVAVSSLVLGKSCEASHPQTGLHARPPANPRQHVQLEIDPMRAADCRVIPEPTEDFAATDTLHAFVRIYPAERFDKHGAAQWTATFVLRSQSGSVEATKQLQFIVDSGSGYLATIELPLNAPGISSGAHTLDVQMRGPGIHRDQKKSRTISIAAAAHS